MQRLHYLCCQHLQVHLNLDQRLRKTKRGGISGVFAVEFGPSENCTNLIDFLRFYMDGTVGMVTICSEGTVIQIWEDIEKWFAKEKFNWEWEIGEYYISSNTIWFSVKSIYGGNSYSGTYLGNVIILSSTSAPYWYPEDGAEFLRVEISK